MYAIKNLEEFQIHINMEAKYTEADISHLRIKILNDMIFNEFNYADDGQSKINEVILVAGLSPFCSRSLMVMNLTSSFFIFHFGR